MNTLNPKKIIIIGPAPPYRGGNSLFVSYLYSVLKEYFSVTIYNYKVLYPSFLFPGVTQYDESKTPLKEVPNLRIINSMNPLNWLRVARKLSAEKADLLIFDWWQPYFGMCLWAITRLIRRRYRGRILFITENVVSHEGRRIDRFLTRLGLHNASYFLALSGQVEAELRQYSIKKVYRSELPVYSCYPSDRIGSAAMKKELGINEDDFVLLFFGYVRKYKGLDILLDAMPQILTNEPRARLLVVGEFYDSPDFYHQRIRDLGIENRVTIINRYVANEEVAGFYEISDVVVLPYRSATQSGILNIAYSFAKPVIVTRVGGLGEFVLDQETGIIVEPDSPQQVAEGVKTYLALRQQVDFAANIQAMAQRNTFDQIPRVIADIIAESQQ